MHNMKLKYVNGKIMKTNKKSILDQYFTKADVAKNLFSKAYSIIKKNEGPKINDYIWLEPSVGDGCFWYELPSKKRIGIDIDPKIKGIIKSDYLKYQLPTNKKIIVIGNPPFGHRGVLALEFIKHSMNADYVCFILPMFFESIGKGSAKYRVKNFNLIHSEKIRKNAFYIPNKGDIDVKCVFQIWSKKHKSKQKEFNWYDLQKTNPYKKILSVYTVSLAKQRECGKKWIYDKKANFYISSTFHIKNRVVKNFEDIKYKSGICVVYNTKNQKMIAKLNKIFVNADWIKYSSLATNSCRHIGKNHIYKLLFDNGIKVDNFN